MGTPLHSSLLVGAGSPVPHMSLSLCLGLGLCQADWVSPLAHLPWLGTGRAWKVVHPSPRPSPHTGSTLYPVPTALRRGWPCSAASRAAANLAELCLSHPYRGDERPRPPWTEAGAVRAPCWAASFCSVRPHWEDGGGAGWPAPRSVGAPSLPCRKAVPGARAPKRARPAGPAGWLWIAACWRSGGQSSLMAWPGLALADMQALSREFGVVARPVFTAPPSSPRCLRRRAESRDDPAHQRTCEFCAARGAWPGPACAGRGGASEGVWEWRCSYVYPRLLHAFVVPA